MNCDDLRPDYLFYALGKLEEPERGELRAHLDRGCENCSAGLREARIMAFGLAATVDGPEPSRDLRARVLAGAGAAPQRRWSWSAAWATLAAAALAGLVLLIYQQRSDRAEIAAARLELERSSTEAASLREALALIQAPETREVGFGEGRPAPPRGRVFFQPAGVLLIASRLPEPPAGKTYEMWIIRAGKPAPAGLFRSDPRGNAFHLYRPTAPPAPNDVVAVTLEAAAGVNAPTSTPVIVAPL